MVDLPLRRDTTRQVSGWRGAGRGVAGRSVGSTRGRLWIASAVVGAIALIAVALPPLAGLDPATIDLDSVLAAPSASHPLGTDEVGRDLLARCVYGMRISLAVGAMAALVSTVVGALLGTVAGLLGGWTDRLLMRLVDTVSAIPHLLLGVFIVALFRPSAGAVIASVALTHWPTTSRIVRAEVLSLRERDFLDAAVSGGAGRARIMARHVLPNVGRHAALAGVLMVPHAIWHESALSFLGLGLPPHLPSLGRMINAAQTALLSGAWWPALFPGLCIAIPTLAIAGLGGALQERLTPKRRSEAGL